MAKSLVVNADDFGASEGINRGIIECHQHGIVTSASLMVTGAAAQDAAALAARNPRLSVGLHWDVWGEDERDFDLADLSAVEGELMRQLNAFERLMGRPPTHIDSHRHAHRGPKLMPIFIRAGQRYRIPVRFDGQVRFVGGFYGQWEWMVTDLSHVEPPFLQWLLCNEVDYGWTEIACHPGYRSPGFHSVYLEEREEEVRTLTSGFIREHVARLGISLQSYHDFAVTRSAAQSTGSNSSRP